MTRPVNVSSLLGDRVTSEGDSVAFAEGFGDRREITWAELDRQVDAVARGLSARGLVAGNRIAIVLTNRIEFVVTYLAALRAGMVAVPMNPWSATGELMRMCADATARVVFCDAVTAPNVRVAVQGLRDAIGSVDEPSRAAMVVPHAVTIGEPAGPQETAYEQLLVDVGAPVLSPNDQEALAALLYTSGTSGNPRAVMLSHRALLANIEQTSQIDPPAMQPDDVVLGLLPLFHVYGLNCVLGQVLATGARMLLMNRFDPDETLQAVADHKVTNIPVAPPVVAAWAGRDDLREKLASVRLLLSGASHLDSELCALFYESCGIPIEQGYGLTETSPVLTSTLSSARRPDGPKPGSVGRAIPGVELRVIDGSGRDAHVGDPGEIWVRGDNLFSGYWPDGEGRPEPDGWYATGDVGLLDHEGDLTLVDRLRELVNVSGFNVYPSEVEDVIVEVPGVAEAAVIGMSDPDTGEAVHAFVVASDPEVSHDMLVDAVRSHCESRLARFKWPKLVTVTTGLPHSATGKVAKGRLRAQARRDSLGL